MRPGAVALLAAVLMAGCSPFGSADDDDEPPPLGAQDVYSIGVDGSDRTNITRTPRISEWLLSRSPDGRRIAFIRSKPGYPHPGDLYVMNTDGREQRRLAPAAPGPDLYAPPAWSPDGRRIAVTNAVGCGDVVCAHQEIWVVDVASRSRRRLTRHGIQPSWSPDGRHIAYTHVTVGRSGCRRSCTNRDVEPVWHMNLMVARADGTGAARELLRGAWFPAWSPRGDLIAVAAGGLVVVSPDGSGRRIVTRDLGGPFAWSPDGTRLAFIGDLPPRIFVIGADGRGSTPLAEVGAGDELAWSPDGRRLAWLVFRGQRVGAPFPNRTEIVVAKPDGREAETITDEAFGTRIDAPIWSADGQRIYYAASRIE
jgi:dipeptidyl aminopeptidase/acylaminoacyl peptidase